MSFQIAVQCVWSLLLLVGINAAAVDVLPDDTTTHDDADSYWHRYYPLTYIYQGDDINDRPPAMKLNNITWADGPTDFPRESVRLSGNIDSFLVLDNSHKDFHFHEMSFFLMIGNFKIGPILQYITTPIGLRMFIIVESDGSRRLIAKFGSSKLTAPLATSHVIGQPYWVQVGFTCQRILDVDVPAKYRCKLYVDSVVEEEEVFPIDMEDLTSPKKILFGRDNEGHSLRADMACVVFDNRSMSVDEIRKHKDICGIKLEPQPMEFPPLQYPPVLPPQYPPCYYQPECYCASIMDCNKNTGFGVCVEPPCKGCQNDEACCCHEEPASPCDDPANCHCYVDTCFDVGFDYCRRGTCSANECDAEHCCCCEENMDQKACLDKPCQCIAEGLRCSDVEGMEYCPVSRCEGQCDGTRCCCAKEEQCPAWSQCHCMTSPCSSTKELHDCDKCCSDCPFGHCCCCDKEWPVCPEGGDCECMDRSCDQLPGYGYCDPARCHLGRYDIFLNAQNYRCPDDQCCCRINVIIPY